ncbi:Plasmodium vivax Vir protein, putative [Plasmodium vivax]|nr:Plasmodium vivax Vir protein, putative [Plasmodium vivax]
MDLQSQIVYKEIEKDHSDLSKYHQICNIQLDPTYNAKVKEICKKSLRFIEKSPLWSFKDTSYNVCLQVNYWLYDKLASILGSSNTNNIQITFGYTCPQFFDKIKNEKRKNKLENLLCYTEMEKSTADAHTKDRPSPDHLGSEQRPGDSGGYSRSSGSELGTQDAESSPESSDIRTKVTNSVLGAAPVLLTATALYRYTPFGSWIRKFRGGNTNSLGAIDMVPNYVQETGDMFSDHEANYISYQPM